MNTTSECQFTTEQFNALSWEDQSAILAVAQYLTGDGIHISDESLSDALNLIKPSDGCVPTDAVGDDLLINIRRKFAALHRIAIGLAEVELSKAGFERGKHFNFCLIIDPSYEDATHVAIVDYEKPLCYLHEWNKAWQVGFQNLACLAGTISSTKWALVNSVKEFNGRWLNSSPLPEE